jgi:hypothetical protein
MKKKKTINEFLVTYTFKIQLQALVLPWAKMKIENDDLKPTR